MSDESKKKPPTAPEGTGDNVNEVVERQRLEIEQLRADKERLLASQTIVGHPSWDIGQSIRQLSSLPTDHPAHRRLLPKTKCIAAILASCHTGVLYLCAVGTKSPEYRIIKPEVPAHLPATDGPAIRVNSDAQRIVDLEVLRGFGVEPQMQHAVLAMDLAMYRQEESAFPYASVAIAHSAFFGKGRHAQHARTIRLIQPAMRLCGLLISEARPMCSYLEEIPEGAPLPKEWIDRLQPTGAELVVYEAGATFTKVQPFERPTDAPRMPPLPGVRDGGGIASPGRY